MLHADQHSGKMSTNASALVNQGARCLGKHHQSHWQYYLHAPHAAARARWFSRLLTPPKHATTLHKSHWCQTQRLMHCKGGSHARVRTSAGIRKPRRGCAPQKKTKSTYETFQTVLDTRCLPNARRHQHMQHAVTSAWLAAASTAAHDRVVGSSACWHAPTCNTHTPACAQHTHPHRYFAPPHTDTETEAHTPTHQPRTQAGQAPYTKTHGQTQTDTNTGTEIRACIHVKFDYFNSLWHMDLSWQSRPLACRCCSQLGRAQVSALRR